MIKRIILSTVCIFAVLFTLFFGARKIGIEKDTEKSAYYKGIINLWHVDTFEGGIGSRAEFLMRRAVEYEKKNDGVLILVTNHTVSSLEENMNNGIYPDMISFGNGVVCPDYSAIEVPSGREFALTEFKGKTYALPWARGSYVMIRKIGAEAKSDIKELIVSENEFTEPFVALLSGGYVAEKYITKPPLEAYYEFVYGKIPYFLGTQRDVIRLSRRGVEFEAEPVENYNDLFQYISIITKDTKRALSCNDFIGYLLSKDVQGKLSDLGLFSVYETVSYTDEKLRALSSAKFSTSLSPLTSREKIRELRALSQNAKDFKTIESRLNNIIRER